MGTPPAPLPKRQPVTTPEETPLADREHKLAVQLSPELAEPLAAERRAALLTLANPAEPDGA